MFLTSCPVARKSQNHILQSSRFASSASVYIDFNLRSMDSVDVNEAKARSFLAQADKRLGTSGFKSWMEGGKSEKYLDAADLFNRAATHFKQAKKLEPAGEAYVRAGDCYKKGKRPHDAATAYGNASHCYKKTNVEEAVICLQKSLSTFADEGRFAMTAKTEKEIAEIYENEGMLTEAMTHFQRAAELFEGENQPANANSCLLKAAHFAAVLEDYSRAIEIFEGCAAASTSSTLLKFSVKEYLLKGGLCHLAAGDPVGAKRAVTEKYPSMLYEFNNCREQKFLIGIIEAVNNNDVDTFTDRVQEFDLISRLDEWKAKLLLKIKQTIQVEEESALV